ncbi:uridine kinase [Micromonospora sp. NIE79]|uniref:Uridine kinase n=1 Tax=Micromonospora trifolii TaxID=2911208 RepID=A0ABS9MYM6_9ACTN|nr:uridine kinase [Micromonospora trifolii]MCG5442767.1 uridine kinase [Micromonospora trifolii]
MGVVRGQVLDEVADMVPTFPAPQCVRVAVDGVDGVGKSTFAGELAAVLSDQGRHVVHVSADDFHHRRAVRHRRGKDSPEGFWLDSYDYGALVQNVLGPFGPGGSRRYRPAAHDLRTDEVLDLAWQTAVPGTVLIVDGLFLHRDELVEFWDLSVFLDAPFAVTVARMARRDGSHPDPEHPSLGRYVGGQRLYFAACAPHERANVVIDNQDVTRPVITKVGS